MKMNPNRQILAESAPDAPIQAKVILYPNGDIRVSLPRGGRFTLELMKFDHRGGNLMLRPDTRPNNRG